MKKKYILLLLSFLCLSALADEPKTQLVVWAKDGTKVAYALTEMPKITFTETDLIITTNGVEVEYKLENMARFTYENENSLDIVNLENVKDKLMINGDVLLFPSLRANSKIAIYSLDGKLLFFKTVLSSGEYAFPLEKLDAGVYLVHVNDITYKIMTK